jgi:hypothetical protein
MKNYSRATIVLQILNATTVTGSAVTVKQATAVAGTGTKALAFSTVYVNLDTAVNDTLVATAVVSNTFTTDTTNSKPLMYVIELHEGMFDTNGGFDCFRVELANATAAIVTAYYILWGSAFAGAGMPSALTN